MNQAIFFDLDGTLWDAAEGCVKAWNEVFASLPDITYTISVPELHSYMGKTVRQIALLMLREVPEERAMEIMNLCAQHEHEVLLSCGGGTLYDSLVPTLEKLKEKYDLCVVSNCESGYIETFFKAHSLAPYFTDFTCAGDTGMSKGENIRLLVDRHHYDKVVYIGDTRGDEEAAVQAGVPFVHAAYGFGQAENPAAVLKRFVDLPAVVASVL